MKSGYGLDVATEIKQLEVIKQLKEKYARYIDIVPTFMGAHAFPKEYKGGREDEYVKLICEEMIPKVAEKGLAEFCDVFCEQGYFSTQQATLILTTAKKYKMKARIHADEFIDSGAAAVAAKVGALSADHLMAVSDEGIQKLISKNVIATVLPGTTVYLGKYTFAPLRKFIDSGL